MTRTVPDFLWHTAGLVCVVTVLTACSGAGSAVGSDATDAPNPDDQASDSATQSSPPTRPTASTNSTTRSRALTALAKLPVKGRAPLTGYSRAQYGPSWTDVDRNGCDTRSDILRRDLTAINISGRCVVMAGTLADPYTATSIRYVRGHSKVDIDHVVALANSWVTGAFRWPYAKRVALANDPLNLLAVDASANRQKSDGDAATWLPPNKRFRCSYVARQIAVKRKYQLWVTPAEADAMRRVLSRCPDKPLPGPGPQPTTASNTGGAPPASGAGNSGSTTGGGSGSRYFRVCADVRAAGLAPLRRGTTLYRVNIHLDRDKDGVACE